MAVKTRAIPPMSPADIVRFWAKVDRDSGGGCWGWLGQKDKNGYGSFSIKTYPFRSHRVAYVLGCGPIPDGMIILHTCNNPTCNNPAHLKAGTYSENTRYSVACGRWTHVRAKRPVIAGSGHHRSRLTEAAVVEIRTAHATGKVSMAELGRTHGVGTDLVWKLVHRKSWTHI